MQVETKIEVGTKRFGGIEIPVINVIFPESRYSTVEILVFIPNALQVREAEGDHLKLVVDGEHVLTVLTPDVPGDLGIFREQLDSKGIFAINLMAPLFRNGEQGLLARTLMAENERGRIISDSTPWFVTASTLKKALRGMPDDIDERLDDGKLGDLAELAELLDCSDHGKESRTLDPSTAN